MKKNITTKDLNCFETKFYIIPKTKMPICICTNNINEAIKNIEDYELENLTEQEITEKINQYNQEKEYNYFNRLKQKDFVLLTAHIHKIGKYKFARITVMDNLQ